MQDARLAKGLLANDTPTRANPLPEEVTKACRPGSARERTAPTGVEREVSDLTSPCPIHLKGALFLVLGLLSATILLLDRPTVRTALAVAVCVWAFCRFYYYLFYVIERYVDPSFRYSGLVSLVRHALRRQSDAAARRE